MKKEKKVSFASAFVMSVLVVSLLVCFKGTAIGSDSVIKWRCPMLFPTGTTESLKVVAFAESIKAKTNGRLIITIYGAGSLMPTQQILDGVKSGMIEMGVTSPAYMMSKVPLANVAFGLPMNVKSHSEGLYFYKILGFEEMMRKAFAKHGVFYASGTLLTNEFTLKEPISRLEDLKGKKLRAVALMNKYITKVGAAGTFIPGEDIYSALATGVLDGAMWGGMNPINDLHLYDVCKYHLRLNFNLGSWAYIVNQKAMKGLPKDIQDIFYKTLDHQLWEGTVRNAYVEQRMKTDLIKRGIKMIYLPPEDEAKLVKIAQRLWDEEVVPKSPDCAEAIKRLRGFLREIGRID